MDSFDSMIVDFIWSGQEIAKSHLVSYATISWPTHMGGLGVISIKQQAIAKVGMTSLWVAQEGKHNLQCI